MSQEVHVIDLRRTYIPGDPAAFAATYHDTQGEDNPEPRIPLTPYAGYNFMPTNEGYASFFGINTNLAIDTLVASGGTGNVDDLFIIQTNTFQNILVALCDDGIWTKTASAEGAWTHAVDLDVPAEGVHNQWSKCVIENVAYVYRQGEALIYQASADNSYDFSQDSFAPTTLNMAGQLGIFKAGGRLGLWDSENSTAWCALGTPTDATPNDQTLAGATIFQDIVGRIVNVLQHGTGFIIYCTKSIVLVSRNEGSPLIWKGKAIFNGNGISYREECCYAEPDTKHIVSTTQGLVEINDGVPQFVIPEVSTYLREARQPIYPKVLNGRYLFLPFLDPRYALGIVQFDNEEFPAVTITWPGASYNVDNPDESICKAMTAAQTQQEGIYMYNTYGATGKSHAQSLISGQVPIFEDHLAGSVTNDVLKAWKTRGGASYGDYLYFSDAAFSQGNIAKIDESGNESFIPALARSVPLVAGFTAQMHVEENTQDFYAKQDWIWFYERKFFEDWKKAIQQKVHDPITVINSDTVTYESAAPSVGVEITHSAVRNVFGPYLDLSYFSEANKYYGIAEKSAWLQRSLTKGINVLVDDIIHITNDVSSDGLVTWTLGTNPFTIYPNWATAFANGPEAAAAYFRSSTLNETIQPIEITDVAGVVGVSARRITFRCQSTPPEDFTSGLLTITPTGVGVGTSYTLAAGQDVYHKRTINTSVQQFSQPRFQSVNYETCVYKELGYTQITGHGHYTLVGGFVVDDAIDEAADYTDICDTNPTEKKLPTIFDLTGPDTPLPCRVVSVEIDDETYSYPDTVIEIPGGTNFLQDGSIEPVYPTFVGAFVYDLHYKRWGKMVQNHKRLLDYFPINNIAGAASVPFDTFMPRVSMLGEDGLIYTFDNFPEISQIAFGKYGQYRKGFTDLHEVRIQNRSPLTGTIVVEGSLNGKEPHVAIAHADSFENATVHVARMGLSARWYNIKIDGNYDLTGLEVRSSRKGKR